eukprot:tig00020660_g12532.t1
MPAAARPAEHSLNAEHTGDGIRVQVQPPSSETRHYAPSIEPLKPTAAAPAHTAAPAPVDPVKVFDLPLGASKQASGATVLNDGGKLDEGKEPESNRRCLHPASDVIRASSSSTLTSNAETEAVLEEQAPLAPPRLFLGESMVDAASRATFMALVYTRSLLYSLSGVEGGPPPPQYACHLCGHAVRWLSSAAGAAAEVSDSDRSETVKRFLSQLSEARSALSTVSASCALPGAGAPGDDPAWCQPHARAVEAATSALRAASATAALLSSASFSA